MDYPIKISEQLRPQLKALRKKRGVTQAELGKRLGVTQGRVVEIEASPGTVSLQQMIRVFQVLGASLILRDDVDIETPSTERQPESADEVTSRVTREKRGSW